MSVKKKDEIQGVPAVNPVAEIGVKVDSVLADKVSALVKDFEGQREQGLEELATLNQSLKSLEGKRATVMTERAELTRGIMGVRAKGVFNIDLKLRSLEKEIKSCQKQFDVIFSKLTEIPKIDFALLNFLSRWKP